MTYDYDGLNELLDMGAYHKGQQPRLGGILASFTRRKIQAHIPFLIAILYFVTGDYIALLRHLRMVI